MYINDTLIILCCYCSVISVVLLFYQASLDGTISLSKVSIQEDIMVCFFKIRGHCFSWKHRGKVHVVCMFIFRGLMERRKIQVSAVQVLKRLASDGLSNLLWYSEKLTIIDRWKFMTFFKGLYLDWFWICSIYCISTVKTQPTCHVCVF